MIGNRTRLVVMLDADFEIWHAWRLRRFAQRMALFCDAQPGDVRCYHSFKLPALLASFRFYRTALFTTHDLGREEGWHYVYPVHEVGHAVLLMLAFLALCLHIGLATAGSIRSTGGGGSPE